MVQKKKNEPHLNYNCVNEHGLTPLLQLATDSAYIQLISIELVQRLIENVDVNTKDKKGQNALHLFSANYKNDNLIEIVELLVKKGVDVNAKDKHFERNALLYLADRELQE